MSKTRQTYLSPRKGTRLAVLAGALLMSTAPVALAQGVDEIIVTVRKRAETLQDVPISVNAQTEEALRNAGATTLEELANNVGGFSVQNLGPGQSQVAIRGVSAGQIVRDQPGVKESVGIYLDESVISLSLFTPDMDLFDLNRVEVLRGPQGTLFGSGSFGGTVRYITNQPNLEEYEMVGELTGRAIDGGNLGGDIKGVINVPIIRDKLALRAVGYYKNIPGFIDAVQPDGSVKEDVNDGEIFGTRVSLRFQPTENLTITPRVIYNDVTINGFNRVDIYNILANPFTTTRPPVTLGEREQFTQLEERFTDEFLLLDATIEYDFGPVTFTSITSYTDRDVLQIRDATQLTGSITGQPGVFTPTGFPASVFTIDAPLFDATSVEMITEEARIASSGEDDRLDWVLGVFYQDMDRRYGQSLPVIGFEAATTAAGTPIDSDPSLIDPVLGRVAPSETLFFSDIPYNLKQLAFFGEATLALTEQLDVTAGVRYFDFEETRQLLFAGLFVGSVVTTPGRTKGVGWSPRAIVSYEVNDNVTINATASKGFRLGGINDPLNVPLCTPADLATFGGFGTWDEETLWNYELGAKTSFMDGRGTFNISAYYIDIDDLQVTLTAGTCSSRIIFNVPKARSMGVEAEFSVQPTDNLDFGLSTSYIDSELRSTVTTTSPGGVVSPIPGIVKGNRLPTVPKFQFSAHVTYTQAITELLDGFATFTFQHVGSRFTQAGDQDPAFGTVDLTAIPIGSPSATTFTFNPKLPAYQIGNLRVGVKNDQWELAFFVNNLWDENAKLALDQERGTLARVGYLTNQPRTFGITARAKF